MAGEALSWASFLRVAGAMDGVVEANVVVAGVEAGVANTLGSVTAVIMVGRRGRRWFDSLRR